MNWLIWLLICVAYAFLGVIICSIRWMAEFTRVHYELEPRNFSQGIPIEKHVDLVMEKIEKEKRWYDNALLEILFWPLYLLFLKKNIRANFVRGLKGLTK